MKEIVSRSPIFSHCNINLISNGLNTNIFFPYDKEIVRNHFSINPDAKIVMFGGISAKNDYNKGYDLLMNCLSLLNIDNLELVIFGERNTKQMLINGHITTNVGFLTNETDLAMLYSAADIVIVPSRQESFSQVCLESISCGTPVVAFDYSGPRDIILHKKNGYLAKPYDVEDLSYGIEWIFQNLSKSNILNLNARKIAVEKFDIKKVAQLHIDLYNKILFK